MERRLQNKIIKETVVIDLVFRSNATCSYIQTHCDKKKILQEFICELIPKFNLNSIKKKKQDRSAIKFSLFLFAQNSAKSTSYESNFFHINKLPQQNTLRQSYYVNIDTCNNLINKKK